MAAEAADRSAGAADSGAIEAVVGAMLDLPAPSAVHNQGCAALANLCAGPVRGNGAVDERRRRAAEAGAIEAAVAAGGAGSGGPGGGEEVSCMALQAICGEVEELRRRAIEAGAPASTFEQA